MTGSLSNLANTLVGQPMFQFAKKVKQLESSGNDIIHFEIGDPYFKTPYEVKNAVIASLENDETHYCDSRGLEELRNEIALDTERRLGFLPDINQIVVAPANALITFVLQCLVNSGDRVMYPDPGFPTYKSAINLVDGIPVPAEHTYFSPLNLSNIKVAILNSPANPTGYVWQGDCDLFVSSTLSKLKETGSFILSDEVYSNIVYNGIKSRSYAEVDKCQNNVIILNSFSKAFSMAGFRIGYIIAPTHIADKVALLVETTLSCLPVFIQRGAIAAYYVDPEVYISRLKVFKERRDMLIEGLNGIGCFECDTPNGAFYLFPKVSLFKGDSKLASDYLLRYAGISALDGQCFGENGKGHLRFSYSFTTFEMIEKAIDRIRKVI